MDVKFKWKETHHCTFMKLKERCHHPSTHSVIPGHNKTLHCVHRCLRRCLWSSALTDTQWNQIPGSFLIAYIYRHPTEMEYARTRSIRHLLRHQEMELLPTRSRHHSKKRPQAFGMVLNGKNENTKINRWALELASYNITFEWISGAKNKAADCLSQLVELPEKHQKNPSGTKPIH